jgi:uncharacterized protein YyaL (SSP411 family)
MPNRLAAETSPYLLQHKDNPVDWYPWGSAALERAKREDKPIFLSIGYSACHWCHVMEHESFENEAIAKTLNDNFVSIKVDREERPDLDQIYMNAVQIIAGRGGWPMSVFLTPELKPFFGGTYWPATSRMGMPGFDQVLSAVLDAWRNRREQVDQQAGQMQSRLQQIGLMSAAAGELESGLMDRAVAQLTESFDPRHGGFGGAPKFPHPMDLRLLLRAWYRTRDEAALRMVTHTLDKMAAGGIYDQLGGGFHRYSVDERWLVPHFEKMLYDNALMTLTYVEAWQATQNPEYERVVRETLDYVLREMTSPEHGFYSTLDADSEGEEGKYYVWTPDEVETVLGAERAQTFNYVYDVSDVGNFEGHNILNLGKTIEQCAAVLKRDPLELADELRASREMLLKQRDLRVRPGLDDKVLVSWNGLMIEAMALAGGALGEPRYLEAAGDAADFILQNMRRDDGRLLHAYRAGQARFDAYLDDYTHLANALVTLYENSFEERWIDEAVRLAEVMRAQFADQHPGGFFYTAADHEELIARNKDVQDASVPSGNGMAALALARLGKLLGRSEYLADAEHTLVAFAELLSRSPASTGQMLLAWDYWRGPTPELVFVGGRDTQAAGEVLADLRRRFLPQRALAFRWNAGLAARERGDAAVVTPGAAAATALDRPFAGKQGDEVEPTLYVCENFTCQAPVVGVTPIRAALDRLAAGR